MASELMVANQQLRDYATKVEELTLAKERNRLAREIHDGLGHSLTTINMQLKASKAVLEKIRLNQRNCSIPPSKSPMMH